MFNSFLLVKRGEYGIFGLYAQEEIMNVINRYLKILLIPDYL